MPHCLRCRRRGSKCSYPPAKPTCFVLCRDDRSPVEHNIFPFSTLQSSAYSPGLQTREVDSSRLSLGLDLPGQSSDLSNNRPYSIWFTSPETWQIDHLLQIEYNPFTIIGLKRLLIKIHRWLTEWAEKGSNPFIHSQLYRTRFPPSVQDAYTTLSCYLHKTASNEQTIFQILEDRAKHLVVEYSTPSADILEDNVNSTSITLDSLEHIARVQALLIYQVLCLYNGDIRLRYIAESHIPVLNLWMQQMVEHASHAVCSSGSITSPAHEQTAAGYHPSNILHCENLWHSWILSESIRRTWLIASGIQGAYLVMQQHRTIPCQGGMVITTRQGVWEAQSARAWEKLCSEVNIGLMQVAETDKLFSEAAPEDVDDFTMLILQATFGEERLERWGIQVQD